MHRHGRERVRVRKEPIAKGRTAAWYPVPPYGHGSFPVRPGPLERKVALSELRSVQATARSANSAARWEVAPTGRDRS